MKYSDFINRVAYCSGQKKSIVKDCVDCFFVEVEALLKDNDSLRIPRFGKFYNRRYKGHRISAIKDQEEYYTDSKNIPTFKACERLKRSVNE